MTQPTDDLAAQMVRENLFTEDELRRMFVIALYNYGWAAGANSFAADVCVDKIRAERAGKEPPHDH